MANDAHYCSHCATPLYPEDRVNIAGGVWQKQPIYFAQRFEAGDIKHESIKNLQVQEGTMAILMDAGEVNAVLDAGAHDIDSLARRINWFGDPPPRSVVLVDVGEVVVPLHIEGLRTSEYFTIEFYGEIILRFKGDKNAARAFVTNILKGERECTFEKIAKRLEPAIRGPVDEICTASTLDDLVRDPERRIRLHERVNALIKDDLNACGVEVVRVSSAEFTGNEYEDYAGKLGQVDLERREAEYKAAMRSLVNADSKNAVKSEHELKEHAAAIADEFRVSEATREHDYDELLVSWKRQRELDDQSHRHELEDRDQGHQHGTEDRQVDHDISVGMKMDEYGRKKKVEDARADTAAQDLHTQQDVKDAKEWLDVKAQKQGLHQRDKSADAARRANMTIEQLLADIADPQQRDDMLKLYQMKLQSGMTPQQILATMGKSDRNDEFLRKMDELYKDNSARADKNFSRVVDPLRVGVGGNIYRGDDNRAVENKNQPNYKP
ncbi:MAG: hypothetical protein IIT98_04370 [Kiritimatiellae bacterium]|nr:hypothetical protein [Kiritimatiellia bacterium]